MSRPSRWLAPSLLLIGLLALAHIWWLSFLCDDAFISFRYAVNLVEGNGLVFNPGERVEGYTNFLWVLISAAVLRLGGRPETWSLWLGGLFGMATLATVLWHRIRRGRDFFFAGILLAANGGMAAWATGGLETSLFTFVVTVAFLSVISLAERNDAPVWPSALFLLLSALTRPEGLMIAVLCGVFLLSRTLARELSPRKLARWLVLWAVPCAAHFLWRYGYYGELLPNSFHVKTSGWSMFPVGARYVLYAGLRFHVWLLLIPGVLLWITRRRWGVERHTARLSTLILIPWLGYVCWVGGDFMDMFRFVVPVLPLTLIAVGQSWRSFFELLVSKGPRIRAVAVVAALLVPAVGLNLHTSRDSQKNWHRNGLDSIGRLRRYTADWILAARRIEQVSRPGDRLATTAAGIIPYYTGLYTIDQLGLTATDLEEYTVPGFHRPGHALMAPIDHLLRRQPHFILGHPLVVDEQRKVRFNPYLEEGWSRRLPRDYRNVVWQLSDSPLRFIAVAVRRDVQPAEETRPAD